MFFRKPKKVALALAGGGARGAYHIGVWRALRELGVRFDIVTGTSVGALTGAIIAQGDYETAAETFGNIKNSDVMELPDNLDELGGFVKFVAKNGGVDTTPLAELLERCVSEQKVRSSGVDFGLVIVRRSDMYPIEATLDTIPEGELLKYMLASASIFPFFASPDIDGEKYIDGGMFNNLPVGLADDMGADEVIAVDLEALGVEKAYNGGLPVRFIRPSWPLGSIIDFDAATARRNMQLGYLDCLKAYRELDGVKYAVNKGDYAKAAAGTLVEDATALIQLLPPLTARAIFGDLAHDYDAHRGPRRMLMALAECAAEVMELDPLIVYSLEQLDRAILAAYHESTPLAISISAKSITADVNRRSAAVSMVRAMESGKNSVELTVLGMARHTACAGAAYICALLAREKALETGADA